MSAGQSACRMDAIAQRWSDLAERRRAHFIELFKSGRWKHYYSEQEFLDRLREAVACAENWKELAGSPPEIRKAS
ncbi:MAG: TIGR03809 family protein [Pseudolabrys sp.]|nr:TIGR03809 family protein [Pseudolabrys sp.]MBV9260771.1 TIGR03809 family protein [Pseudolabrys sp.]